MPEFVKPFSGMTPDRKMTAGELTRAIRLSLSAEEEAIHLYEAMADATDNELAAAVLRDIADEEKVHVGEFQHLLKLLLPDEEKWLQDGAAEVNEMAEAVGAEEEAPATAAEAEVPSIGSMR